jgi:hypothetical protein
VSRGDRLIGIVLGLVIGVVAVILFVFAGGGGSIDAPSLDSDNTTTTQSAPVGGGSEQP